MSTLFKIIIFLMGLGIAGSVLMLLVNKKISERNTLAWYGGVVVILILSVNPLLLDKLATIVGVDYPPSLLFLITVLILLVQTLYQSIQISALNDKLKELSQFIALQHYHDKDEARGSKETEPEQETTI
jgi:hypothetical protein